MMVPNGLPKNIAGGFNMFYAISFVFGSASVLLILLGYKLAEMVLT
jgi:hypothetical protein